MLKKSPIKFNIIKLEKIICIIQSFFSHIQQLISRKFNICNLYNICLAINNIFFIYIIWLDPEAKTIQLLVLLILPGHITFFFTLFYIPRDGSAVELSASLVIFYLLIAFIQVIQMLTCKNSGGTKPRFRSFYVRSVTAPMILTKFI